MRKRLASGTSSHIGYYNRSFDGIKDIVIDPDRGRFMTEMYERTIRRESGRDIYYRWRKDDPKFTEDMVQRQLFYQILTQELPSPQLNKVFGEYDMVNIIRI